ncbi:MAG: carboxypeptidase regulatory-like domain-containing protein [Bryobacterales bacterium]|nr:carboxypeptidase regulatory-like domain-containing protein [Bryobacterales bacterium]
MSNFKKLSAVLSLLTGFATALFSQTGTIQGTLTDAQGGVVANARVTATDEAKNLIARETVSSADGRFSLRPLLPGTYTIKSEVPGFKALEQKGLKLDQNQIMELGNIVLQVGQTTESVTISAETPLVETATANKSFVISSRQVTELSLNGRDFQSLMRTLPGVVSNDRSDFRLAFNNTDAFNVNGLRGSANNVFLDGTINTDVGANDGQYTQISLDAVGEFKVQTSTFNAEYGRNPGIMISINTKSGSRDFHGTAYWFLRNNYFDARQPFDTTGKTQPLNFNQAGGNISGPIYLPKVSSRKDPRMFFFFNYEGTRATRPIGGNFIDLAHPDLLNGDLSRLYRDQPLLTSSGQNTGFRVGQVFRPGTVVREAGGRIIGGDPYIGNIIPKSEWSRNAAGFIKVMSFFPNLGSAPPTPGQPETVRYPYQQVYGFKKDGKVLRYDWALSSKANFFFRWADDAQQETQSLGIFATLPSPIFPQYRKKPGSSWSWNLVNVISPSTTNEFIFGYNRLTQVVDVQDGTSSSLYDKAALGFQLNELYPDSNLRNRFPRFSCGVGTCGYSGFPAGWASDAKQFAWTDNVTLNRGAHTFKGGVFFNMNLNGQQPSWTDVPNFNFGSNPENPRDTGNTFANMLLGNYTSVSQTNGRFYGAFKFFGVEWYLQDSWKVRRNFTLEYGVRWAYLGPTYTTGQYLQNYWDPGRYKAAEAVQIDTRSGLRNGSIIPGAGNPFNGIVQEGNGIPQGFAKHRYNNWGPRAGFAWDPFGNGKTSVRGGAGIFYERIRQNANNFDGLGNPPLVYTPNVFAGRVDELGPALVNSGVRSPVGLSSFDPQGQIPTIYSWSIGVQRELGRQTSIDIAYVGNAGRYLQYRRDLNQLPLGTTLRPGLLASVNNTTNALRPYLGYTTINWTDFGAISNYNALQARVTRRFSRGLTGNFNYTWSKAMAEIDSDTTALGYSYNRHREYGPAGFDRTHIVTIDFVYELPRFVKSSGIANTIVNGWQINGITRFWSGNPATILCGNCNPGTLSTATGGGAFADYAGGPIYPDEKTRRNYFNVAAFARPAEGTLGNLGKNTLRLPGINNWDVSLFKNFRIHERINTQFRFETFNTFNHTQWSGVNTTLSVPNPGAVPTDATRGTFGEVNSTRDPRTIQFGLKFLF